MRNPDRRSALPETANHLGCGAVNPTTVDHVDPSRGIVVARTTRTPQHGQSPVLRIGSGNPSRVAAGSAPVDARRLLPQACPLMRETSTVANEPERQGVRIAELVATLSYAADLVSGSLCNIACVRR